MEAERQRQEQGYQKVRLAVLCEEYCSPASPATETWDKSARQRDSGPLIFADHSLICGRVGQIVPHSLSCQQSWPLPVLQDSRHGLTSASQVWHHADAFRAFDKSSRVYGLGSLTNSRPLAEGSSAYPVARIKGMWGNLCLILCISSAPVIFGMA
jgi:hypothetical protein